MTDLAPAPELAAKRAGWPGESDEYAKAREALLTEEIEVRRHIERLAEQRRALPLGPVIDKPYRFVDEDGAEVGLGELFGPHDTLIAYSWMYGPDRPRPCPMCTNMIGPIDANARDLAERAAMVIIGRSPIERQLAFKDERGWRNLQFVEAKGDDFPHDLRTLLPAPEGSDPKWGKEWEMPALHVFTKKGDEVRLFWAGEISGEMTDPDQDPRGSPEPTPLWNLLDLTPEGRGKDWYPKLSYDR